MRRRVVRAGAAVVLALVGGSLSANEASSAAQRSSCDFHAATGTLVVGREGLRAEATIHPRHGDILVDERSCGATVRNTDSIRVIGEEGETDGFVHIDLRKGPLAPGTTPERHGPSEIEVHLRGVRRTELVVFTTSARDDAISVGSRGVNLNGDGDADLIDGVFGAMEFRTHGGSDSISTLGGHGTGPPDPCVRVLVLAGPGRDTATFCSGAPGFFSGDAGDDHVDATNASYAGLSGDAGDDVLIGSQGDDVFRPGAGADVVFGSSGRDTVVGTDDADEGDDVLSGGTGIDTFDWGFDAPGAPTTVSLDGLPNDGLKGEHDNVGKDFEIVVAQAGPDTLIGNGRDNTLIGSRGDDDITGGGGRDRLFGGEGDDVFHAADGESDRIWGGKGDDTATDRDPIDRLRDIEAL